MTNRITPEARKLILDDLILIGKITGGQNVVEFAKRTMPNLSETTLSEISRHMDRFDDWEYPYLFDAVMDLKNVPDDVFINFCEQYVHPILHRSYYDERIDETIDLTEQCIAAINKGLSDVGLVLKVASQIAGRDIYKVLPATQGPEGAIKNIIFAAKYKPDIVIRNVLSNDIEVIDAKGALIYDQGISEDGIRWNTLSQWYDTFVGIDKTMASFFYDSLDSDAERLFFKAYCYYIKENGNRLPALLPQVYLYYDPKTYTERGLKIFEHQKMDFMMIIKPNQRVVIEIDGQQHYAEDSTAPGEKYKRYASPKRYAEMMSAHREMSLAGYEVYRFGGRELWVNEWNTEEIIINRIKDFFSDLFKKFYVI